MKVPASVDPVANDQAQAYPAASATAAGRPCVLVFAGSDPSGGAGIQADIPTIGLLGAHPLTVVTALTVQDNNRVLAVHPVTPELLRAQAEALIATIRVAAVKIGVVGSQANADVIADIVQQLRQRQPDLPVVFDPVLASGQGDALGRGNALLALTPLVAIATLITPNLPEAAALCPAAATLAEQAAALQQRGSTHVLIKGGHGPAAEAVQNQWFGPDASQSWRWPRLPGPFHGTGCTLASGIAALLAQGQAMPEAIAGAQEFCQAALSSAYPIADGQQIPNRPAAFFKEQE